MAKKTVAIYDRWLYTLGGGEQVAFAYAEALRDFGFDVSLLTHLRIDEKKAQEKMGVNLSGINLEYLPPQPSEELSALTEKYDIFLNTSFLDYFPNRSKLGILSVFFPIRLRISPAIFLKERLFIPLLRSVFIYPTNYDGFRYDEQIGKRLYKWLGRNAKIHFSNSITHFTVTLFFESLAFSVLDQIVFYVGAKQVFPEKRRFSHHKNQVHYSFSLPLDVANTLEIRLPQSAYARRIALLEVRLHNWRYAVYNLFKYFFPIWEMRLHGTPGINKLSHISTYQKIITISEFSRHWIQEYWGAKSEILYPPVSVDTFAPAEEKKNWIVHVGRFFLTGHNKKQLELAEVFAQLCDKKLIPGWELHFIGSIHDGEQHQKYFNSVRELAEEYPIYFHIDIPQDELKDILSQSKIYWHATGLDEDENRNPIHFEHFGITTVEAMASGNVPVVINAGGQKEIVTAESGFLWNTREELMKQTADLIEDSHLLEKLSQGAIKRSKRFSRSEFKKTLQKILDDSNKKK